MLTVSVKIPVEHLLLSPTMQLFTNLFICYTCHQCCDFVLVTGHMYHHIVHPPSASPPTVSLIAYLLLYHHCVQDHKGHAMRSMFMHSRCIVSIFTHFLGCSLTVVCAQLLERNHDAGDYTPVGKPDKLWPGAYYLRPINEKYCCKYGVMPEA